MTVSEATTPLDQGKLEELVGQFVVDLGAALHAVGVVVGDRLGLYGALAEGGPASADELAARSRCEPRSVREWLRGQAAGGYVSYDPQTERYALSPEQAFALADPRGLSLPGGFLIAISTAKDEPKITQAYRSGSGLGWHEHHEDLFPGTERFFRAAYGASLTSSWIPSLPGVEEQLRAGARVADVGCGHGASTILMALAYPSSSFLGFDYHDASIDEARKRAEAAGVADRVSFQVASASGYPGRDYDLVTVFDALHDLGDPVGAAGHVRRSLKPDGAFMLVEPFARDDVEENFNPVGRMFYNASALICVPSSVSQEVGAALGAQAGERRLSEVLTEAGFGRVRRAAETPFNLVIEARP
jgi:SAM-dependent methyltransferase